MSAYHDINQVLMIQKLKGKKMGQMFDSLCLCNKKLCHSAQWPSKVYWMTGSDCNLSEIIQPAVHESGAKSYTARSSPLSF